MPRTSSQMMGYCVPSWAGRLPCYLIEDCDSLTNKPHMQFVYLRRHLWMYTCRVLERWAMPRPKRRRTKFSKTGCGCYKGMMWKRWGHDWSWFYFEYEHTIMKCRLVEMSLYALKKCWEKRAKRTSVLGGGRVVLEITEKHAGISYLFL
jgi:hypothetical protein